MNRKQISLGAVLSYFSLLVNITAGLIYTPWMVKSIGQSQYGIYTLANSLITLFLVDFGLSSAAARYVSNYHAENNQEKVDNVLGVIYRLYIIIDCVIFTVFIIIFFFVDTMYVNLTLEEINDFKVVYIIAASYSVISFPFVTLNGIMTAYEKFIELKIGDLFYRIFSVVLVVVALSLKMGLYALVAVNAIVGILTIIYKILVLRKNVRVRPNLMHKDSFLVKEVFEFSFWITVMSLAQRLVFTITPSILGIVADTRQIAVFGVISVVEGYVFSITTAINGMFMPTISRFYAYDKATFTNSITPLVEKVGKYNFAINALLVAGIASVGKEFIIMWMGEDFIDAYWGILAVIIPGLLYNPLQVANTAISVCNKVKYEAIINIVTGLVNVFLSFVLSGKYGAIGASASIFIAYTLKVIMFYILHQRVMQFNMLNFAQKCYLRMIPCFVIPLVTGLYLSKFLFSRSWIVFSIKVMLILIAFFISLPLCFNKNESKGIYYKIKSML